MRTLVFLLVTGCVACGGETAVGSNTSDAGMQGQGGSDGSGGSRPAGGAGVGGRVGGGGAGGSAGTGGGSGGGGEIRCGGADDLKCPEGYFCRDGACGLTGAASTCSRLPADCPIGGPLVCGCDAKVYSNACGAIAAGQGRCFGGARCGMDISNNIKCEPPPDHFACGTIFCTRAKEFCETISCLAGWQQHTCKPIPAACSGSATCDCVKVDRFTCAASPAGDLTLTQLMGPDFCTP